MTAFAHLPASAPLHSYIAQVRERLEAWRAGDPRTIEIVRHTHPRFLRTDIPWLPIAMSDDEARQVAFDDEDARLSLARSYEYPDWAGLEAHVSAAADASSPVGRFERAVDAVITGDLDTLRSALRADPGLVAARSTRITSRDPPRHGATLLHYIAANGVEGYRQKTPPIAVAIARTLLEAGSDPNALAWMYGGEHATMSMLVSSSPPADAGLQPALVDTLVDFGASVEPAGAGDWTSPLIVALAFGFLDTAETLVRRGARIGSLPAAAGLGRVDQVRELLPAASHEDRHRALALAAQHGHAAIVSLLLDAGESPDRYNPEKFHAHSTPLHQAALAGHEEVVRLLVSRGARLDLEDRIYQATPLGWAVHAGKTAIADFLRAQGSGATTTD
jgi:ankyrin repeat protein